MQGEWRQNLEHKGIEIEFPGKPPAEIRKAMKDNGFRWAGSSGVWYAKNAPDRIAWLGTQDWATAGEAVGAPLSFEERIAVKQERAEARTERLEGYIESAQARSADAWQKSKAISDGIPFGQPILVGHHSEGRHRRDIAKMSRHMDRSVEASNKALELQEKAAGVGSQLKGYDNPGFLARRIKECAALVRKLEKRAKEWEESRPVRAAYLSFKAAGGVERGPGWDDRFWDLKYGGYTEEPEVPSFVPALEEAQSKLDFCQAKLEELGGLGFGPHNIQPGMRVVGEFGEAIVKRANRLTATLAYLNPALRGLDIAKCEYGRIKEILPAKAAQ